MRGCATTCLLPSWDSTRKQLGCLFLQSRRSCVLDRVATTTLYPRDLGKALGSAAIFVACQTLASQCGGVAQLVRAEES